MHLSLGPEQIARAVRAARLSGTIGNGSGSGALLRGAREQNAASLERLARRIEPPSAGPTSSCPPR